MIDTNETGQKKLTELAEAADQFEWSDYELKFIEDNADAAYPTMSSRQKAMVGQLHDKLMRGGRKFRGRP